jgi:hypothetical protein
MTVEVSAPKVSVAVIVSKYVPALTLVPTEIVARFVTDVFIVIPADAVALVRVNVLLPVP